MELLMVADITLPGTRPSGDDQAFLRELMVTLSQIQAQLRVLNTKR